MRQDVLNTKPSGWGPLCATLILGGLCLAATGCRMAHTPAISDDYDLPTSKYRSSTGSGGDDVATYEAANPSASHSLQSQLVKSPAVPDTGVRDAASEASRAVSTMRSPSSSSPAVTTASATIRGQSPDQWNGATAGGTDLYRTPMQASQPSATGPPASSLATNNWYAPQTGPGTPVQYTAPTQPAAQASPYSGNPYGTPATGQVLPPPTVGTGNALPPPTNYGSPNYGYGSPGSYQGGGLLASPSDYGATLAPGASSVPYDNNGSLVAPGSVPNFDPTIGITAPSLNRNQPRERTSPLDVYVTEGRTGRITLGGSVNSDLGVAGQLVIDERNFDIRRFPRNWDDLWSGRAFRGYGQTFRAEIMPGTQVERYTVSWSERNLFGYLPYSLTVGGFLYSRQYRDWTEQRLGGRVSLGYEITKDIALSGEIRMEDVKLYDPRIAGVAELDDSIGSTDLYTARARLARDTRDSPFMATEGGLLEVIVDQVFGERDYTRGQVNISRYFLIHERPDQGGRHTLASTWKFGFTGSDTPIFENYFAGGYSTMRGFSFRGASPKVGDVQVGGEFMFLGSLEYVFPLTADEMLRGVAFVDYGTIEQEIEIDADNFRVAPGLGLRVSVPALGPAPLAFDFAVPVAYADSDDRQIFSFFMGMTR